MAATKERLDGKTAIVTGGANGIGAAIVRHYEALGANVVIADLPSAAASAEPLVNSLSNPSKALFVPVNITIWREISALFQRTKAHFGQIDYVVANAGIMETRGFFDFETDAGGNLMEDEGVYRVIDVNLNGTMNTLRLAMFHMMSNPVDQDGFRGSIVLTSSTSGFFGGTAVVSYVASKHGVVGLLRSSQAAANKYGVRVNSVAPFVTPTFITEGYSTLYKERGLPMNKAEDVASAIIATSVDVQNRGRCFLVYGGKTKEIEEPRAAAVASYMGEDVRLVMDEAKEFFDELGGYPLPRPRF
ncbi:hypothetical protein LTR10_018216 [Elasticomyces elasticus]|uniref:Uncharacterized protein n=1 Tax=Exophiala sideris TaxID=1016849 RepID=A0ABR0JJ76_9EURO|nr:hypothetical protein LTR10_018216 [Elasticomyces elasticus]KAK5034543.1 hypothetical protein LTS07_003464 [Exophiala sideris]KAK5042839.1 hypothetical protein LTR13_001687 [Exophiala sideris]KAK5065922.1 hypothetical protein LTR69_003472 [Exophiala sideris]KAK5185618.1 hypothetical protein LTR44_001667 [Eurotiomycetes sp. CCFEE 6388]